jgi:hypothetical protein
MPRKNKEKKNSNLHKYTKKHLQKLCSLEVYKHLGVCMHEHFNLNSNPFKYEYEIY